MNTTIKNIELILTSEYSTKSYVEFVQNVFSSMRLIAHNNYRKEFSNFSSHIMGYTHIGEYITSDSKKVAIFSVELKNAQYVQNSRSTQRSYAKKLIEAGNCDAALVAFYTTGDVKWRISFVRLDYEMKIEHGKLKTSENITPAKRYSFLVGKDEPCHTAIDRFQQFIVSGVKHSLDEIEEAFSVERVTKEFFELYCEKFYQLQEYLDSNEDFVEESKRCGFTSEQFAKKLMGQIVFLYFLQKKGWLGVNVWPQTLTEKEYKNLFFVTGAQGRIIKEHLDKIYVPAEDGSYRLLSRALDEIPDEDEEVIANHITQILVNGNEESRHKVKTWGAGSKKFLRTIFEFSQKHKGHFYEYYLEPLFYSTLNKNRGNMGYCPFLHCRVPFLSGGLFDPLDGYDWRSNHFDIPDAIFSNKKDENDRAADGILDIFDRYNFTMSEDEPLEREVAIDPEMLGKIFENLLEVRDRKSKGAFYTPREIVHYMCQESLVNYLVRKTGITETALRDFILYGDFMKDEDTDPEKRKGNGGMYISEELFKMGEDGKPTVNRLIEVDNALATVRVADPAVGSGAFPLGMVNEIVRARQNITAYISIGMNANSKRLMYKNERSPYMLKYTAIRDSIFAVDIEPSAVDIAQLRLWLSLVIDDEVTPDAANDFEGHRNPLPLPNLECNIICGNSLIDDFMGIQLINSSDIINTSREGDQLTMFGGGFDSILKKLLEAQDELFRCDEPNKKESLKKSIQDLKDLIITEQLDGVRNEIVEAYEGTKRLASKPYVLWQLDFARVFRDNGGFDIVIGNPPYVSYKYLDAVAKKAYNAKYPCATGQYDLYGLFMERGFQLLAPMGFLSYITSSTYFNNKDFVLLRKYLLSNSLIKFIVNLDETIFTTAQLDVAIIGLLKQELATSESHQILVSRNKKDFLERKYELREQKSYYNESLSYEFKLNCSNEDNLLISKMNQGSKLLDFILDLPRGIEIGGNSDLISDIQHPGYERLLVGRNLKRYDISFGGLFIKFDETDLSCFKDHSIYLQPKILIQRIRNLSLKQRIVATIDTSGYLCTNTLRIGILKDINFDLYYILGILNSKITNWLFLKYFLNKDIYSYQLKQIPIKVISFNEQAAISSLVKKAMLLHEQNQVDEALLVEREIDAILYRLYGLTNEEIDLVETECK